MPNICNQYVSSNQYAISSAINTYFLSVRCQSWVRRCQQRHCSSNVSLYISTKHIVHTMHYAEQHCPSVERKKDTQYITVGPPLYPTAIPLNHCIHQLSNCFRLQKLATHRHTFLLLWPWPWPDDLHIWNWPDDSEDVPALQKWTL